MSYSRKGCFVCGNLGHIAANCSSPTRICFNCRASDHESNQCPHPRTTEAKQCYSCAGVGHIASNCPSTAGLGMGAGAGAGGGGQRCYSCGFPGHIARSCPQVGGAGGFGRPPMGGMMGGFPPRRMVNTSASGAALGMQCYRCNGTGHFARDCPTPVSVLRGPKACYRCAEVGHLARDCPTNAAPVAAAAPASSPPSSGVAATGTAAAGVVAPTVLPPALPAATETATSLVPAAVENHA